MKQQLRWCLAPLCSDADHGVHMLIDTSAAIHDFDLHPCIEMSICNIVTCARTIKTDDIFLFLKNEYLASAVRSLGGEG